MYSFLQAGRRKLQAGDPSGGSLSATASPAGRTPGQGPPRRRPNLGGDVYQATDQQRGGSWSTLGARPPSKAAWPSRSVTAAASGDPSAAVPAVLRASTASCRGGEGGGDPPRPLSGDRVEALMRDVAARIIQTYWRSWRAWKSKVGEHAAFHVDACCQYP